ncbi:hypothetical protein [Largemouth bass virus]|nr:hypothetical protein [Largemouth bass virus]
MTKLKEESVIVVLRCWLAVVPPAVKTVSQRWSGPSVRAMCKLHIDKDDGK